MSEQEKELMASILVETVGHLSGGNPGSIKALLAIVNPVDNVLTKEQRTGIIRKMQSCRIHKSLIYTFYNDICNKDLKCMSFVAENASNELLLEACLKDDYSGRIILKEVLDKYYAICDETSD